MKYTSDKEVIQIAMKDRQWSFARLGEELNMPKSSVSGYLYRGNQSMRCDTFVKLLSAMGYEVVIRDKYNAKGEEYILTFEKED